MTSSTSSNNNTNHLTDPTEATVTHADLSYPQITTQPGLPESAFHEYRERTSTGIVSGEELARRVTTRQSQAEARATRTTSQHQNISEDIEAAALEKFKFVTFKEDDREDPRQWSNAYKWCKAISFI